MTELTDMPEVGQRTARTIGPASVMAVSAADLQMHGVMPVMTGVNLVSLLICWQPRLYSMVHGQTSALCMHRGQHQLTLLHLYWGLAPLSCQALLLPLCG